MGKCRGRINATHPVFFAHCKGHMYVWGGPVEGPPPTKPSLLGCVKPSLINAFSTIPMRERLAIGAGVSIRAVDVIFFPALVYGLKNGLVCQVYIV